MNNIFPFKREQVQIHSVVISKFYLNKKKNRAVVPNCYMGHDVRNILFCPYQMGMTDKILITIIENKKLIRGSFYKRLLFIINH